MSFAGLALLGGLWLLLTVWPGGRAVARVRHIVWTGWGLTVAGTVAETVLQGPYTAGRGLGAITDPSLLDATLATDYGLHHSVRLMTLAGLAVTLGALFATAKRPGRRQLAALASWPLLAMTLVTFSGSGHARTTPPVWVSVPADVLHLAAMSAWVGGLVLVLAVLLPRNVADELRAVLPGFSRIAFGAVVTLALTGAWAAWHGIGTPRAVLTTRYGLLVLAKVALFVGLIALGDYSRRAIRRRFAIGAGPAVAYAMSDTQLHDTERNDSGREPAGPAVAVPPGRLTRYEHGRMWRSVLVEVVVAGLVLAATAVLVDQPRGPETVAARDRRPVQAGALISAERTAVLTLDPGVHGQVTGVLVLGPGVVPQRVSATIAQPERRFGPLPLSLRPDGVDRFTIDEVTLPYAGTWVVALTVTMSEFEATTAEIKIKLH